MSSLANEEERAVVQAFCDRLSDLLLYVGLSRAVVGFSLISPTAVAERLGLFEPVNGDSSR